MSKKVSESINGDTLLIKPYSTETLINLMSFNNSILVCCMPMILPEFLNLSLRHLLAKFPGLITLRVFDISHYSKLPLKLL